MTKLKVFTPTEKYSKEYDIPLTKSYNPSFYEWLFTKGEFIVKYSAATGNVYVVPSGYTYFLMGLWCSVNHNAVGRYRMTLYPQYNSLALSAECAANTSASNSISFPFPIPISSGSAVQSSITGTGNGGCIGYLVKNDVIPFFTP